MNLPKRYDKRLNAMVNEWMALTLQVKDTKPKKSVVFSLFNMSFVCFAAFLPVPAHAFHGNFEAR